MNAHDIGLLIDGAAGISIFYLAVWFGHVELEDWRDRKVLAAVNAKIAARAKAEERSE